MLCFCQTKRHLKYINSFMKKALGFFSAAAAENKRQKNKMTKAQKNTTERPTTNKRSLWNGVYEIDALNSADPLLRISNKILTLFWRVESSHLRRRCWIISSHGCSEACFFWFFLLFRERRDFDKDVVLRRQCSHNTMAGIDHALEGIPRCVFLNAMRDATFRHHVSTLPHWYVFVKTHLLTFFCSSFARCAATTEDLGYTKPPPYTCSAKRRGYWRRDRLRGTFCESKRYAIRDVDAMRRLSLSLSLSRARSLSIYMYIYTCICVCVSLARSL